MGLFFFFGGVKWRLQRFSPENALQIPLAGLEMSRQFFFSPNLHSVVAVCEEASQRCAEV